MSVMVLEANLKAKGYTELAKACQAIVGSDGTRTGMCKSVDEDGMKEHAGIPKVHWIKHKLAILEDLNIFRTEAVAAGLDPTNFLATIEKEVIAVEELLSKE